MISRLKLGCELRSPQCSGFSLAMTIHHSFIQLGGTATQVIMGLGELGTLLENTRDWHGKNGVRGRVWKTTA